MLKKMFVVAGRRVNRKVMTVWVVVFSFVGFMALLLARGAPTPVTVDNSLPNPTNVSAYADDRVATVTWDPAPNAQNSSIVGYYVTWGTGGVYTNAKQTTYTITQIQPLTNGTNYNVKVQSVQGSQVNITNSGANHPDTTEKRANGKVSTGATTTVTPSSARVDALRTKMTGFFDDFNTPAGAFDELKWNHAATCTFYGSNGAFINNQYHAHNQLRSGGYDSNVAPCWDRGQMASRARGVFDISGTTEANPGEVVFDFDGVQFGRDIWYMDFIPVTERTTGIPIDVGTHQGSDDDLSNPTIPTEPKMIRLAQMGSADGSGGLIHMMYYGDDQLPHAIVSTAGCSDQFRNFMKFTNCGGAQQNTSLSPLPEPNIFTYPSIRFPIANVRAHWRMQITTTKIKVFVNNVLLWEGAMPADFRNTTKYHVYSTLFSYNTGKDQQAGNSANMLHWDNFGFTGPASTTVTHNYLEGGANGSTLYYLGPGTIDTRIPATPNRSTRVNIPDNIGSPTQARLMLTLSATGHSGRYTGTSSDTVTINGKTYPVPTPASTLNGSVPTFDMGGGPTVLPGSAAYSVAVIVNASDLKKGMNDIKFNLASATGDVMVSNAHIELDYAKGTEPTYTQPKDVFGASAFLAAIQPTMSSHDSYLFIEQDMGLPTGVIAPGSGGDTQDPTVSITRPVNGSTVTRGEQLTVEVNAQDNVGINKIEIIVDGNLHHTITHTPYNHTIDTSNWTAGSHKLRARAYDAANNNALSAEVTINISQPASSLPGDLNKDGQVNFGDLAILLANYGRTNVPVGEASDINNDRQVNFGDLAILLANYGKSN